CRGLAAEVLAAAARGAGCACDGLCDAGTVPDPTHPGPPSSSAEVPDPRPPRRPGDGWVECRCGQRHWGRNGAAGLLLWRPSGLDNRGTAPPAAPDGWVADPADYAVVLQHRALWSHHGGTWGMPGGAVDPGESAV